MRLSGIKLAGFKSFVDPTSLPLPSRLTSVVGPNGCGKSNLIDAVRWVLGEASIKNLRGADSEDVIFNGSRSRKPAGRASVELTFDNSDFQVTGPFAAYAELAVKRELTRDGGSQYYLNGTKCLKRDVTDLFLGTGLGGKNQYAIIEQGMVSRMVEAKPEELRQLLEEAAGIEQSAIQLRLTRRDRGVDAVPFDLLRQRLCFLRQRIHATGLIGIRHVVQRARDITLLLGQHARLLPRRVTLRTAGEHVQPLHLAVELPLLLRELLELTLLKMGLRVEQAVGVAERLVLDDEVARHFPAVELTVLGHFEQRAADFALRKSAIRP